MHIGDGDLALGAIVRLRVSEQQVRWTQCARYHVAVVGEHRGIGPRLRILADHDALLHGIPIG